MPLSSGDESDSVSENEKANKKQKLHEKDKTIINDKDKKSDVKKSDVLKIKEKPSISPIEVTKESNSKEGKLITVRDMIRAQRDASLKVSSHINKGSKSTSSATSDDSSSSESDSSDSSSDADVEADVEADAEANRNSDDDDDDDVANNLNNKGSFDKIHDNAIASNYTNKIQLNGTSTSNNIPQEVDLRFLDNLVPDTRDSISRFIESSKNLKDNSFPPETLGLLYKYVSKNTKKMRTIKLNVKFSKLEIKK